MCNSDECTERNLREMRRHLDTQYDLYGDSDKCWCGYVHFDDDGNTTNVCPLNDSDKQNVSVKDKWRDQRRAV